MFSSLSKKFMADQVTTAVVVVCLLVAGCSKKWTWEDAMQALRDDPMASASWEGLELLGEIEEANDKAKPPPPAITRCFKLTIPPEEAMTKVKATAEEHGWVEDASLRTSTYVNLEKVVGRTKAGLAISSQSYRCEKIYQDFDLRVTINYP